MSIFGHADWQRFAAPRPSHSSLGLRGATKRLTSLWTCCLLCIGFWYPPSLLADEKSPLAEQPQQRSIEGWSVHVHADLLTEQNDASTQLALRLLESQLKEIVQVVPAAAVKKLRQVPLWFSPEYPRTQPRAEYHPQRQWLLRHNRNPAMAKCVEFSNTRIFEAESRRMPNFTLHELAHAYHDQCLEDGFDNAQLKVAFQAAKDSGSYDRVERRDAQGKASMDRAYALSSPQEYFAESSEAYFSRNDFFPFDRRELVQHDPRMCALLEELWGTDSPSDHRDQ